MISLTPTETLPLEIDADGVVRVGKTRVSLDTIILAFTDGATAEEIAQQYPSLQLADIYSVIGYYLRHPSEVEAYLGQRAHEAEHVRHQNEARSDTSGVRDRLLARPDQPSTSRCPRKPTCLAATTSSWLRESSQGHRRLRGG